MGFSGLLLSSLLLSVCPVFSNFLATEKPESITVLEGGTAIFHCHVSQQVRESFDIAWFSESRDLFLSKNALMRNNLDTDIKTRYSITRIFSHRFDLYIENVKPTDAGKFVCMFAYKDNPLQKAFYSNVAPAAELIVLTVPTVDSPNCLINDLPSGEVEFVCVSEGGNPKPSLQLYADDTKLQNKPEVNGRNIYVRVTLTEAYRGVTLQCVLESKALQLPRMCSLLPLPPVVRITPKHGRVVENGEIQFNCTSHGLSNPTYEWMATPKLILMQRFSSDSEMVTLTIREAHLSDNGSTILCIATGANGDKITSEEAILMVEGRVETRGSQTTIGPSTAGLQFPVKPRAKHSVIDFFQNNVIILAVFVAGVFIVLLSMIATFIVFKRKRSYKVNEIIDDEILVDKASYEKNDQRMITNSNLVSQTKEETENNTVNRLVSPATSPTRSQPTSPKQSPTSTLKNIVNSLDQPLNTTNGGTGQPVPQYAKPIKVQKSATLKHPTPAYATPMKRDFHLSLEDLTMKSTSKDVPNPIDSLQKNEYAEPTNKISPTKTNIKNHKYEQILPSPVVDPRKLNVEGLKYAHLEINQNSSTVINCDLSMKTQYAELANPMTQLE